MSVQVGVSKNRGKTPKMDGENNGSKPYFLMDDLGGKQPLFLVQHPSGVGTTCLDPTNLLGHNVAGLGGTALQRSSADQHSSRLLDSGGG